MKIKKNDQVQIITGKDRGKRGKVLKTLPVSSQVVVEGLNVFKKHSRPKKGGEKGQRIEVPAPLNVSKVMLVCPHCGKLSRTGQKIGEKGKMRFCKKCKSDV